MRDRVTLRGNQNFLCSARFDLEKRGARAVNHRRLRTLAVPRRVGSLVIAIILRWQHVRRFGTTRAFVVRGHEDPQYKRAVAGDIAIERTSERYGIFRRIAPTTPRAGGFYRHIVRDWWLRICGYSA